MKTLSTVKITDAIRALKDHQCEKCGSQAKGFIYHKVLPPIYYCRECLRHKLGVSA